MQIGILGLLRSTLREINYAVPAPKNLEIRKWCLEEWRKNINIKIGSSEQRIFLLKADTLHMLLISQRNKKELLDIYGRKKLADRTVVALMANKVGLQLPLFVEEFELAIKERINNRREAGYDKKLKVLEEQNKEISKV